MSLSLNEREHCLSESQTSQEAKGRIPLCSQGAIFYISGQEIFIILLLGPKNHRI